MIRKCSDDGYFRGEVCPYCKNKGKFVLDSEKEQRIGKFVSGVLRHFPNDVGLSMDKEGWVDFDGFLDATKKRYKWAKKESLISLVESDEKQRYEIISNKIRARYGHSVNVDLNYSDNNLSTLYYGVSQEEVDMVFENGIFPIRQTYVHLSTSYDKANQVAQIHTENPIILGIDCNKARNDGITVMGVNKDIALMEKVPTKYIYMANE
ncbi:RNA 2'-phosphotransferase [Methanosalsum natronophilum]|nr:RNA 2'-phosphotransferase [Methanosalsum natronophilum]MCS3923926.1 putative RNA 2'-phosphotransferase [Methanosalsum natronophilum]